MCYLGVLPRKNALGRDLLQNAYDHNSDGWGVMYAHAGRVVAHKEKSGMKSFFKYWDQLPGDKNIAVHFRFGTSGPMNSEACHPFMVLSKDLGDAIDLWLMHNGVLRVDGIEGDKHASDTMQYVSLLRTQLRLRPELLRDRLWKMSQEALLGNPNKVVLLEGNGRWTYLNQHQGDTDKESGVWHSNTYSLRKVYSGHGKGRAANTLEDDWSDYGYYGTATRNDAGHIIQAPSALQSYSKAGSYDYTQRPWGLQIVGEAPNAVQVWWKPTVYGYVRMARNPETGKMYRDFWSAERGEKVGDDTCTVLPTPCFKVQIKDVAKFEAGAGITYSVEGGEHVISGDAGTAQTQVTLYKTSEASAAVQGGTASICFCRGNTGHPQGEDPKCKLFPLSCHATREPTVAETLAKAETLDCGTCGWYEPRDGKGEYQCDRGCDGTKNLCRVHNSENPSLSADGIDDDEMEDQAEAYADQLFSDANMQDMDYDAMLQAVEDYPERAALHLGLAHGRSWAFRMLEAGDE